MSAAAAPNPPLEDPILLHLFFTNKMLDHSALHMPGLVSLAPEPQ